MKNLDFKPKNKEIEHILDRLIDYPVIDVNPRIAQSLSRYNKIRFLSNKNNIYIRKGLIGLPKNVKIKKKKDGWFDIDF